MTHEQEQEQMRFLCWWDTTVYVGSETKIVGLDFFIDEHGYFEYNEDYRGQLSQLKIGESFIPDEGPTTEVKHIITRIR